MMIKGHPCKVLNISVSKTGKHGHAKCNFVATDIFTGKKYEDGGPTSHNIDLPHVSKTEYELISIDDGDFITVLLEDGSFREDIKLREDTDDDIEVLFHI